MDKKLINTSKVIINKAKDTEYSNVYPYNKPIDDKESIQLAPTWKGYNYICCKGNIYAGPRFYYGLITEGYLIGYSLAIIFVIFDVILLQASLEKYKMNLLFSTHIGNVLQPVI